MTGVGGAGTFAGITGVRGASTYVGCRRRESGTPYLCGDDRCPGRPHLCGDEGCRGVPALSWYSPHPRHSATLVIPQPSSSRCFRDCPTFVITAKAGIHRARHAEILNLVIRLSGFDCSRGLFCGSLYIPVGGEESAHYT